MSAAPSTNPPKITTLRMETSVLSMGRIIPPSQTEITMTKAARASVRPVVAGPPLQGNPVDQNVNFAPNCT
jgi:hypothetical protein